MDDKTEAVNMNQDDSSIQGVSRLDLHSISNAGIAKLKKEFILITEHRQQDVLSEPEVKKARLEKKEKKRRRRGQNKGRGVPWKEQREAALCPTMADVPQEEEFPTKCSQEHCKLQHDVKAFLSAKPPDLGTSCPLYQQFGRCPRGAACRYGKEHLTEDGHNIINTSIYNIDQKPTSVNQLSKDVQFSLRKFKYNFTYSEGILAETRKQMASEGSSTNGKQDFEKEVLGKTEVKTVDPSNLKTQNSNNESEVEIKVGPVSDEDQIRLRQFEKKKITWKDQLYLSPLTTVGNLPFRRLCRYMGADVTCGEMAMASSLLQGAQQEWALVRRHESEKLFGVQLCGSNPQSMARCAQLLQEKVDIDFVDINMGCPIDLVYQQGGGSGLLRRRPTLQLMVRTLSRILDVPLTIKTRTGVSSDKNTAHTLMPSLREWNVSLVTLHGRSREQRYTRSADWAYIDECAKLAAPVPLFGNGDILSYEDYNFRRENSSISGVMIGRGALIKPWVFTEIKEQRHWDISSSERLDLIKKYTNYGLEHWGSDTKGVETTRRFLLEWLSFLHRYIPVGLLEVPPQKINERPPLYHGRDDLETLMCSSNCADWVKISEMLLGKVPEGFNFLPKHKANAWQ